MKTKINEAKNSKNKCKKKKGNINLKEKNSNSLKSKFFNQASNKNKISIIINFLDINEQLPLFTLNSIISTILINKYNLPFKSIEPLKEIKNNKIYNDAKYSEIYFNFINIIDKNHIPENEYQFIQSYLLKNITNNFIIFDSLEEKSETINGKENGENDSLLKKYKIFFGFLSKIKFINNITHIKLKLCDVDNQINGIHLNKENFNVVYFNNFFKNINHLEIEKITNSLCFINKLITYTNNSINNVTKINLSDINIKMNNEEIIDYNIYNSLSFPELTKLKYLSLVKVNLSVFCLNEIISKNCNLIRIVVLHCSNNNISLYDEKEYAKLLNKSIKNCKELNYVNFNKNNFSINLINQIVYIFIEIFFKSDKNIL